MKFIDRIGEENYNAYGTLMKIVEYKSAKNIIVEFQDEYKTKVHTSYQCFKKGGVKNLYDRSVYGVGYIGVGKYKTSENGKSKLKYLGLFPLNRPFQAFTCYKQFKENHIKQIADEYKDLVPEKLYEAMYKYEVEIND